LHNKCDNVYHSKKPLTRKEINDFKKIYYEHYGKQISNEEAIQKGTNLVNLFEKWLE